MVLTTQGYPTQGSWILPKILRQAERYGLTIRAEGCRTPSTPWGLVIVDRIIMPAGVARVCVPMAALLVGTPAIYGDDWSLTVAKLLHCSLDWVVGYTFEFDSPGLGDLYVSAAYARGARAARADRKVLMHHMPETN